mmetsp:Transcript_46182/g.128765  ORF Transcript_46182/g.128765 Transcript_46182/m.128765 type:complete len:516 (+) Transcript_46182:193-1740(+)
MSGNSKVQPLPADNCREGERVRLETPPPAGVVGEESGQGSEAAVAAKPDVVGEGGEAAGATKPGNDQRGVHEDLLRISRAVYGVTESDSYVVSFEGSRNDVVVLDKSCDVLRWLAGTDERAAAINDWYAKYHFTPISTVLGISSFLGFFVALMQDDQSNKKWWYWALAAAGVLLPANMLGSRSPRLLRMEATNFDMLFNCANGIIGLLLICVGYEWDARAAVLLLVIGPTAACIAFSDAGLSDFEYSFRVVFLPLVTLIGLALVTWEQGGLAKDTTPTVWVLDTVEGPSSISVETFLNLTTLEGDDDDDSSRRPWEMTMYIFVSSVACVRVLFFCVFAAVASYRSIARPTQCSVLSMKAARRIEADADHGGSGSAADADFVMDDESSRVVHEGSLDDDSEVVVLTPAKGIPVCEGPGRCVLYLLLRDIERTQRWNAALEENKKVTQTLMALSYILTIALPAFPTIPLEFCWVSVLAVPDLLRILFVSNVQAAIMCMREPFSFWNTIPECPLPPLA